MRPDALRLLARIIARDSSGYIEVRSLRRGDYARQAFIPAQHYAALARVIGRACESRDVYVGAAPRARRAGTREAIDHSWCAWVDCDTAESVARLATFTPRPTLVIYSGSSVNCHAWWALSEKLTPAECETLNRRLAAALHSDERVYNIDRILRPPGTFNHKTTPPTPVRWVAMRPEAVYRGDQFGSLPDIPVRAHRSRSAGQRRVNPSDPTRTMPATLYGPLLSGAELQAGSKIVCPFHADTDASLKLYDNTQSWYCFGCQRGGDIYDFAALLWDMGTRGTEFQELKSRVTRVLLANTNISGSSARYPRYPR